MHPLILQQLAADHIDEMITKADGRRHARQARRAPPARIPRQRTRDGPPRVASGVAGPLAAGAPRVFPIHPSRTRSARACCAGAVERGGWS